MTVNVLCLRHGGTHLTLALVKSLTSERVVDVLKSPKDYQPLAKTVISWRNPRDLIVSKLRFDLNRYEISKKQTPYLRQYGVNAELLAAIRGDYGLMEAEFARDEAVDFLIRSTTMRKAPANHTFFMQYLSETARKWNGIDGFYLPFETISNPDMGEVNAAAMGEYLGSDGGESQYRQIYGTGRTFNENKSNWREWFGNLSNEAFEQLGGNKTANLLGYE